MLGSVLLQAAGTAHESFLQFLGENLELFLTYTGVYNATPGHLIMILVGLLFIFLAIKYEFEPMLLIPIGFGILIGNIPFKDAGLQVGIYEQGSVLNILYQGVTSGWYPPLIFLGIGAMTDFSALISNPKLMLIGAAAQFGIFGAYIIALQMGFEPNQAGAIGIIGGADGPTAIFLSSKLAPNLMGAIAVSAYSYMALVPIIQPPFMRLLTTQKERLIRMKPPRAVSSTEKIVFPIVGLLLTCFLVPSGLPLLGMLFFGNLLKESGVTRRLAETARGPLIDTITILLGITVGASTQATQFLTLNSIKIFGLGALSFVIATCAGILFVKFFNLFLKEGNKINPLIGNSGVSAVPDSARISQNVGLVAMTKVVNRFTIMTGAVAMILAGLFPPIGNFFASLPQSVLGGCTIMMFGTILTSGMQMIANCGFTQRNITIVAMALSIGIGFTTTSESGIWAEFSPVVQSVFSANVVAVVFVVAIIMNLILPKNMEVEKLDK